MTLEEQLRLDFSDDTEYERLVLETIADPNKAPPGSEFATNDIRGNGPRSFGRGLHDSAGGASVESLAARLRPLAFGAAYKIVDFVVEMTMRLNGEPCPAGRWRFDQKNDFLRGTPSRLPAPLDSAPNLWLRTARLYAAFDEHRHALVHRRTRVQANGDFTGSDPAGAPLAPISVAEQDAFSRFATALSLALIAAANDQRELNTIAWNLDALDGFHGCGVLGAMPPPAVIVQIIDDMKPVGPGRWKLDGVKLHAHLREQHLRPIDADAQLHAADDGQDVVYTARLDEVPDAAIEVDEAALPIWLRRSQP